MRTGASSALLLALIAALAACGPKPKVEAKHAVAGNDTGALLTVGSLAVNQADLDHQLRESHGGRSDENTRREALAELTRRAQLAQAALDADLLKDPLVRAEFARVLANRLKEKELTPRLKQAAESPIPDARLRELYAAGESRFRSAEKRQVAVLWLNPNGNPERETQYIAKLTAARDWLFNNADLAAHPDQGFATLGVDHSEHQASRYQGGVVGWMESGGGMDGWTKALAEIAFALKQPGETSAVLSRPEGVFLVRYMALKPAFLRPFEAVADELRQAERQRLRKTAQAGFDETIAKKYPVRGAEP